MRSLHLIKDTLDLQVLNLYFLTMIRRRYFKIIKSFGYLLLLFMVISCVENDNQNDDLAALQAMFEEIQTLASSVACTDATEWTFVSYGSKACGGPQGYIAYSTQIDVANFLSLIEEYSTAEREYNIRWGIVSTCDLPDIPAGVSCQNGDAVLIY